MVTAIDKNTALLLVDLQKGVIQMPFKTKIDEILVNAVKLIAVFRQFGLPIVIINVNPTRSILANSRKEIVNKNSNQFNEDWIEIVPEIITQPDDIFITKHTWGAFYETCLHEELQKRQVTGIVLGGVATSIGVEGTARHASERGYNITFAKDAMTDMFSDAHENSLKYIFPRIGEIDTTDRIVELISLRNIIDLT